MRDLKPCPFCGSPIGLKDIYFGDRVSYYVSCPQCYAQLGGLHKGDFGSPEEAVVEWNRRANDN